MNEDRSVVAHLRWNTRRLMRRYRTASAARSPGFGLHDLIRAYMVAR